MIDEPLKRRFQSSVHRMTATVVNVDLTVNREIIAIFRRDGHKQTIAILDLPLPVPQPDGAQWIEAYRGWNR